MNTFNIEQLFNSNTWFDNFTANLVSEAITTLLLGIFLFGWIEKTNKTKERKENQKVIANLIAAELEYNRKKLNSLIMETPKGNVVFPALASSAWNSIDKPEFISFYKPQDLANILQIYRRVEIINKMYDSLLETSNWAAIGRISIVRAEFLNIFINESNGLKEMLDRFFAGIKRKSDIKMNGLIYKGILIRQKTKIWNVIPWISNHTSQAIYPNIYVPKHIYDDLTQIQSKTENVALLEHEKRHIKRQKKIGFFLWMFKYTILPKFRLNEEMLAIKDSMLYLKSKKIKFDIEKQARWLSSWMYLWMISYNKARNKLRKAWLGIN